MDPIATWVSSLGRSPDELGHEDQVPLHSLSLLKIFALIVELLNSKAWHLLCDSRSHFDLAFVSKKLSDQKYIF
jgi:hypothetical protein